MSEPRANPDEPAPEPTDDAAVPAPQTRGAPGDEGDSIPAPQVERDPRTGADAAADRGGATPEPPD